MQILITVIAVIVVVIVILIYLSHFAFNLALTRGDVKQVKKLPGGRTQYPATGWIEEHTEEVGIVSDDGLQLKAAFCDRGIGKFVILCHGYRNDRSMFDIQTERFFNMGFGVLAPDARGHGRSGGKYIGMGWPERRDVIKWCGMLREKYGEDISIILYGISMGAATVMMAGGEDDLPSNVKCIIEDCGFTTLWDQSANLLKLFYSLPPFPLLYLVSGIVSRKEGYSVKDASALDQIKKCKVPVLFIHGDQDTFVPFGMRDILYDAAVCPKEKYTGKGSRHAVSYVDHTEQYFKVVEEFIKKYS